MGSSKKSSAAPQIRALHSGGGHIRVARGRIWPERKTEDDRRSGRKLGDERNAGESHWAAAATALAGGGDSQRWSELGACSVVGGSPLPSPGSDAEGYRFVFGVLHGLQFLIPSSYKPLTCS